MSRRRLGTGRQWRCDRSQECSNTTQRKRKLRPRLEKQSQRQGQKKIQRLRLMRLTDRHYCRLGQTLQATESAAENRQNGEKENKPNHDEQPKVEQQMRREEESGQKQ